MRGRLTSRLDALETRQGGESFDAVIICDEHECEGDLRTARGLSSDANVMFIRLVAMEGASLHD